MGGPTTEVLDDELKDRRVEVHRIEIGLAELRAEIRVALGFFKWATGFLGGAVLAGIISTIGWGLTITTQVQGLRIEMNAIRTDVDKLRTDGEKTRSDLEKLRGDVEKIRMAVAPTEVKKAVHESQSPSKP